MFDVTNTPVITTKGRDGWVCTSTLIISPCATGKDALRIIELVTAKGDWKEKTETGTAFKHGIKSSARVSVRELSNGWISKTHKMFEDYYETVDTTQAARVTKDGVIHAHANALKKWQQHIDAAKVQYVIPEGLEVKTLEAA